MRSKTSSKHWCVRSMVHVFPGMPTVGHWDALKEFGKCLIPLSAHSVFLLGTDLFSELSQAPLLRPAGMSRMLLVSDNLSSSNSTERVCCQGTWKLYFSHFTSSLGSLLPRQMAFLSCFWKVHMAYKREYLFNCKT